MSKFLQSHSKKTVILGLIVFVFMAMWPEKENSFTSIPVSLSINKTDPSALDYSLEAAHIPLDDSPNWNPIAIRSGDSLSTIFRRAGLSAMELHDIMLLGRHVAVLGK